MNKIIIILMAVGVAKWWYTDPTISVDSNNISFSYVVKQIGNTDKNDQLPMLIALHGNGDTVGHFYDTALDQYTAPMRIILLTGPVSKSIRGSSWPWTPDDFKFYGKAVSEAVELLSEKFPTKGKPMLLGFSGGGMMAYYQAVTYGDLYSYIFPISGNLSLERLGEESSRLGALVHAFHGKSDSVVGISGGREAVKILQEEGITVDFTEFDGGHHGVFLDMKSKITQTVEEKINLI